MATSESKMSYRPRWILHRGESAVASSGLVLASLLLFVMGLCAWWSVRTQDHALVDARQRELEAVSRSLAEATATMLTSDDPSAVRRLVVESARSHDLAICRVMLADDTILAHNDPSLISDALPPRPWPTGAVQAPLPTVEDGQLTVIKPLTIPGLGAARVDLVSAGGAVPTRLWEAIGGIGIISALGLMTLLVVYRRMRHRLEVMAVIRDALLAQGDGETTISTLMVQETLGPEASAWNALLNERQALKEQLLSRKVEETLMTRRESSHDLDSACDVMRQGLVLVDANQQVTYANGAAAVFLQATRDELMSTSVVEFIGDQGVRSLLDSAVAQEMRTWNSTEVRRDGDDAAGVLRFSVRPLRKDDTSAAVIVIDDVTQQRVADETRNSFVAQVTHELRAPLTNIRLYAESAIADGEGNPELQRNCLNVINTESERLERIVGDMLSVSEIEAGQYRLRRDDVALDVLLEDVEADYEGAAKDKSITMVFELPPKLPVIHADRDKISLTVHNLVGNAIKYTPEGGRVEVRAEDGPDGIEVVVSDNGIGIDENDAEKVFNKFYRADDTRVADVTGSGLGLALARQIARMHGGDIVLESQINQGSTFTLKLPPVTTTAAAA